MGLRANLLYENIKTSHNEPKTKKRDNEMESITNRPDIMSALKKAVEEAEKTKIIIFNSNLSKNDKLQAVEEILCLINSLYKLQTTRLMEIEDLCSR